MQTARIDLHLHLDGSLNLAWAYKKALLRNAVDPKTTFEEFYNIVYANNLKDRALSIRKFELMCDVLQYREDLYEATFDLVHTLWEEGLFYAEIRFASQQHTKCGLSQKDALQAVIDGAADAMDHFPGIRIGIINCMMHKGDSAAFNEAENRETIRVTKELLGKGAVGLDLAGFENNTTFLDYAPLFAVAAAEGIPYTMHAGEMGIGTHVLDALQMGADRIGHGVNCVQDPKILEAVLDANIPLEVCVSSNVKRDLNYAAHPVRFLIDQGAKVTLNEDNRVFARTTLPNEHALMKMIGITEDQLMQCTYNAVEAAFCDDDTKEWLYDRLEEDYLK
ncbi:MAG: hypothetical protein IJ091_07460 [Oscillospiraceae bacterium]|nr:hypothetical protein [Oscillospiraceae bacterium]